MVMSHIDWRVPLEARGLWPSAPKPTAEEQLCFKGLLGEIREQNWAQELFPYSRDYVFDDRG